MGHLKREMLAHKKYENGNYLFANELRACGC